MITSSICLFLYYKKDKMGNYPYKGGVWIIGVTYW